MRGRVEIGDVIQVTDIHSDLYLKIGEILDIDENDLLICFEFIVIRDNRQVNECVVDHLTKDQIVKAWWRTA